MADSVSTDLPCEEHAQDIRDIWKAISEIRIKIAYMIGAGTVGAFIGGFLAVIVLKYFKVT